MDKKHYEKTFEVNGVNLRVRKLRLTEFPSFKTIYATAIDSKDIEGLSRANEILLSWLEYDMLEGTWVPVYNTKTGEFVVDAINDTVAADTIINTVIAEVLMPLFLNTVGSTE